MMRIVVRYKQILKIYALISINEKENKYERC